MPSVEILVVDDDEALRTSVSRMLRGIGHVVREAVDGADALRSVRIAPPDLIITDIMMPDSDGIELIGAVKTIHPAVRIIAISGRAAFGDLDLLNLAGMIGADVTLTKPMSPDELLEAVARLTAG
jgi:CheY-like chemotaxis protein